MKKKLKEDRRDLREASHMYKNEAGKLKSWQNQNK